MNLMLIYILVSNQPKACTGNLLHSLVRPVMFPLVAFHRKCRIGTQIFEWALWKSF